MSPWFSHMPIPKSCLLRHPRTGTGQSSTQNMASSILSPESTKQADRKKAYCVPPPFPNKKWKGSNLFFLKGFWCRRVQCCSQNHDEDSGRQWRREIQVCRLPARDSLPSFLISFLRHYLNAYQQASVGYIKGIFKLSWWKRSIIQQRVQNSRGQKVRVAAPWGGPSLTWVVGNASYDPAQATRKNEQTKDWSLGLAGT